ncbi:MAG: hypothetical protein AAGK04_05225 [Planctomycetota bacterium]
MPLFVLMLVPFVVFALLVLVAIQPMFGPYIQARLTGAPIGLGLRSRSTPSRRTTSRGRVANVATALIEATRADLDDTSDTLAAADLEREDVVGMINAITCPAPETSAAHAG